jgi:hypothetical protein
MILNKEKLSNVFLMLVIGALMIYLYVAQIQEMNAYLGMKAITINLEFIISLLISLIIILGVMPSTFTMPSSIFVYIFILFTLFPIISLYGVSGVMDIVSFWNLFILLLFSILTIKKGSIFIATLLSSFDFTSLSFGNGKIKFEWILVLFLILVFLLSFQKMGMSFGLDDSYDRRLIARDRIGGALGYMISIGLNGVSPFLSFIGIYKNQLVFFVVALLFSIAGFGLVGTKAPFAFVCLLAMIGFLFRRNYMSIMTMFLYLILAICVLSFFEYLLFDYSSIADYLVRRMFATVAQTQGYYYDYIVNSAPTHDLIYGLSQHEGKGISYLIGENYSGKPEANDNTNAFLFEIGRNGILGYLFQLLFLSIFYGILDVWYKKYKMIDAVAISVIYSLIIVEQSYSVALITSGVLFIAIFVGVFSKVSPNRWTENR